MSSPNRLCDGRLGRIHEELISDGLSRLVQSDVEIKHLGYVDPAEVERKTIRNVRLLKLQLAERPDDPQALFHLGGEYMELNSPVDAWPLFCRSLELSAADAPWRNRLLFGVASAARCLGYRPQEAQAIEMLDSVGTVESRMLLERLG